MSFFLEAAQIGGYFSPFFITFYLSNGFFFLFNWSFFFFFVVAFKLLFDGFDTMNKHPNALEFKNFWKNSMLPEIKRHSNASLKWTMVYKPLPQQNKIKIKMI